MTKDPVCGMPVEATSEFSAECGGETYYFCSVGCREKYLCIQEGKIASAPYDLIIVGGGPAGLTAGTFAATLRIKAFLIPTELGGQAGDSTKIENYMGFDFISGPELVAKFRHQLLHSHYIDHLLGEVDRLEPVAEGFRVTVAGNSYFSRALILATGMTRRRLGVPGEERFQRRGIFYGNLPDYFFLQGEEVAVIGGGNSAMQMVENLHGVARQIHLISRSNLAADAAIVERIGKVPSLTCHEGYETLEFTGEQNLTGVMIRQRETGQKRFLPIRGAFIAIGLQPNSSLVERLLQLNGNKEVPIGSDCSTSFRGLFAAGDVTEAYGKRIIIAAGEGAKAAIAAKEYLLFLDRQKPGRGEHRQRRS
jgi:alkyl hydroperoxide reductase subunit F